MFQQGWKARRDAARYRAAAYEAERNNPRNRLNSDLRAEHRNNKAHRDAVSAAKTRLDTLVTELVNLKATAAKFDANALRTGQIDDRAQATEYKIAKMPAIIKQAEAAVRAAKADLAAFEKASAERIATLEIEIARLDAVPAPAPTAVSAKPQMSKAEEDIIAAQIMAAARADN